MLDVKFFFSLDRGLYLVITSMARKKYIPLHFWRDAQRSSSPNYLQTLKGRVKKSHFIENDHGSIEISHCLPVGETSRDNKQDTCGYDDVLVHIGWMYVQFFMHIGDGKKKEDAAYP